ncbi:hypothetical protein A3B32_00980 [Candidatus Uhrbacteria bacterium RIFCSPLOWO2_01_FULL_53_9]|uniref:DUF2062 domain-containing protein n=2 Tax=Candidatus Uhriibacteriota TaxID=1752732 RepID=A0A1F7UXD8_9BACT|nr:MAG: hypothetical protein A3B32_00980 [Candidatus Uhrbacteria bacterium RIFCSPLOWO2_01_FULL_53_9]OGL89334.1 MAG: hypothetical protein A3I45_02760 [Candidatus Uhrbacteria bacterium RIFCSPLOWO2_02_FULL_53_10]
MSHALPHRLGRTLSLFAGLMHLIWIILIWIGAAQPWLNFVYGMHAMKIDGATMVVQSMPILGAIFLSALALVMGYVVGWVIGMIWERVK